MSEDMIEKVALVAASAMDGISEGADHIEHFRIIARALGKAGLLASPVTASNPVLAEIKEADLKQFTIERSFRGEWEINGNRMGYGDPTPEWLNFRGGEHLGAATRFFAWARAVEKEETND